VGSKVLSDLLLREGPKIGNVCHLGCSFTSCQGGDVLVDFGKELPFFVPAGQLRFTQNTGRNRLTLLHLESASTLSMRMELSPAPVEPHSLHRTLLEQQLW